MSRSAGGYMFKCGICGYLHLLVGTEPYDGITVYCYVEDFRSRSYKKKDFEPFHGMVDMFTCPVEAKED